MSMSSSFDALSLRWLWEKVGDLNLGVHLTLYRPMELQPSRLLCPWNFLGKNTGECCHFFLQGIFLTQGLNPSLLCLLHWQADSLPRVPLGKPLNFRNHIIWSDGILVSISNFISGILMLGGRCLKFLLYRFSTGL